MRAFLALFFLATPLGAAWQIPWSAPGLEYEDWGQEPNPPKGEAWQALAVKNTPPPRLTSTPSLLGEDLLWLWQHTLSGKDGSHCPYYPSCSRYSRIAVENYGLALGVVMTADRLTRCNGHPDEAGHYERRAMGRESMIWDPPQLDAWWVGP